MSRSKTDYDAIVGNGSSEVVCYAFTSSYHDRARLNALADLLPLDEIIAVGEMAKSDTTSGIRYEIREHNFRTMRGFKAAVRSNTTCIVLDWWWIAPNYFAERYGENWISEKVPWAFSNDKIDNLLSFILPNDRFGKMQEMIRKTKLPVTLQAKKLSWAQAKQLHPLVRATENAVKSGLITDADEKAQRKYVDADYPFFLIQRRSS